MNTDNNHKQSMQSDEIYLLVATELGDTLTADESRRLEQWKAASRDNAQLYDKLVSIWHATPDVKALAAYDSQKAFDLFLERVAEAERGQERGGEAVSEATVAGAPSKGLRAVLRRRALAVMRYAAAVAVVVGVCSYAFYRLGQHNLEQTFAQIVVEAPEGATSKVTLPDGTSVWLNAGSRLAYSQGFGVKERNVHLTGEGYFEVHKNREMPFNVTSGSINVKVLGTKFDFRDYAEDNTAMVSLDEGSVALALTQKHEATEYMLKPNQRAVLDKRGGNLTVEDYTARTACLWTDGTILLNGRRLADIATDLSRAYAARIVIADKSLGAVRFYGVFHRKDQSLMQILNTLAGTGRIRYTISGNVVRIY